MVIKQQKVITTQIFRKDSGVFVSKKSEEYQKIMYIVKENFKYKENTTGTYKEFFANREKLLRQDIDVLIASGSCIYWIVFKNEEDLNLFRLLTCDFLRVYISV